MRDPSPASLDDHSLVVALTPVEMLMIPGELFVRAWFHSYRYDVLDAVPTAILPG